MHPACAFVTTLLRCGGDLPALPHHSAYVPRYTKVIAEADVTVHAVVKGAMDAEKPERLVIVPEDWVPHRLAYCEASDARSKARKIRGEVRTNCAVMVQRERTLYSPADIHEALLSASVTERLGDLPFFPAHLLSVNLSPSLGNTVLQFRNLTSMLCVEDLATETEQRSRALPAAETPQAMRSELALLAAALAVAQQKLHLKHMDCHSGNVMWSPRPAALTQCVIPHLWGQGRHLMIPMGSHIPAIIDFGLSTAQWRDDAAGVCSLQRMDYHLLETDDNEEDWGLYSPELDGDEGYDLATYVESAMCDLSDMRPQPLNCLRTLQEAHAALGNIPLSTEGRPLALVHTTMQAFLRAFCPPSWEVASYTAGDDTLILPIAADADMLN